MSANRVMTNDGDRSPSHPVTIHPSVHPPVRPTLRSCPPSRRRLGGGSFSAEPLLSTPDSSCRETIDGDMAPANNLSIYSSDGRGSDRCYAAVEMLRNCGTALELRVGCCCCC